MINAIFFDLDGTLVDSAPGIQYGVAAAWNAVRPGPPCPDVRPLMGPPVREMFRRALPGAPEAMLAALERAFRAAYDGEGWKRTVPFAGVLPTLSVLNARGLACFGVTNKPQVPTQRILVHCGLAEHFRAFRSPDSRQPAFASKAEATQALLGEHGLAPAAACLVGDTVDDARAAQACGLRFFAFSGGYGWPELQSARLAGSAFADFPALPRLIERAVTTAGAGGPPGVLL